MSGAADGVRVDARQRRARRSRPDRLFEGDIAIEACAGASGFAVVGVVGRFGPDGLREARKVAREEEVDCREQEACEQDDRDGQEPTHGRVVEVR